MNRTACLALALLLWGAVSAMGQSTDDAAAAAEAGAVAEAVLDEGAVQESTVLDVPGSLGAMTRSARESVTLSAIDAATREITLVHQDGRTEAYTAGAGMANFDQLAAGDRVTVTSTESMAVYRSEAEIPESVFAAAVVRAEDGAVPGGRLLAQGQVTAQVVELHPETRRATLLLAGGETRTIEVAADIDLSRVNEGDTVAIALAKSLEIDMEQP
jgi:hypothetical protein